MPEDEQKTAVVDAPAPETNTTESPPAAAGPTPPVVTNPPVTAPPATPGKGGKKKLSLLVVAVAVVLVLLGASAGAYYGLIVPNKPENVLKTAISKLLEQPQTSSKGTISIDMKDQAAELKNVTINFTAAEDRPKKAVQIQAEGSASGVKLPVEFRVVDKAVYFKVGDLNSIKSAVGLAAPEAAGMIDVLGEKISNQWIEIDNSLLKQASADCVVDNLFVSLNPEETKQIMKLYDENAFLTIKNTRKEQIEGVNTTRAELGIDKQKAQAFGDKLTSIESLKKATECGKAAQQQTGTGDQEVNPADEALQDADVTAVVWIDNDKNLRQLQLSADDKEATVTFTVTYTNDPVDIKKPEGAKPLVELLGDLSAFFGGPAALNSLNQSIGDVEGIEGMSDECLTAYQAYIASGGTAPLPAQCEQ